jgi:hypothetical protein
MNSSDLGVLLRGPGQVRPRSAPWVAGAPVEPAFRSGASVRIQAGLAGKERGVPGVRRSIPPGAQPLCGGRAGQAWHEMTACRKVAWSCDSVGPQLATYAP